MIEEFYIELRIDDYIFKNLNMNCDNSTVVLLVKNKNSGRWSNRVNIKCLDEHVKENKVCFIFKCFDIPNYFKNLLIKFAKIQLVILKIFSSVIKLKNKFLACMYQYPLKLYLTTLSRKVWYRYLARKYRYLSWRY